MKEQETRALLCTQCGAPFEAPVTGGMEKCAYCGAINEVRARPDLLTLAIRPGHQMTADERRAALEEQGLLDATAFCRDPYVEDLKRTRRMGRPQLNQFFEHWVRQRPRMLAGTEAAFGQGVFFDNASLIAAWCETHDELPRKRAVLEGSVEVSSDHLGKQRLLRLLVAEAAGRGDLTSAADWLACMDGQSADLGAHSDHILAQAILATGRSDWDTALRLQSAEVAPPRRFQLALFVANARLRMGDPRGATECIVEAGQMLSDHFGPGYRTGALDVYDLGFLLAHYAPLCLCEELFEIEGDAVCFVGARGATGISSGWMGRLLRWLQG